MDISQNIDMGGEFYKLPGVFGCLCPGGVPMMLHEGRILLGYVP